MSAKNRPVSKPMNDKFTDNYDRIFGKKEEPNQCDGCIRGLPVVNGIHKDEQMFGMACTKVRYEAPLKDRVKCGVSPSTQFEQWDCRRDK